MTGKTVAMLFRKESDGRGGYTLRPITTMQWLNTPQVASICNVSVQTIHRDRDAGLIKGHLFRSVYRYSAEDVEKYILNSSRRERVLNASGASAHQDGSRHGQDGQQGSQSIRRPSPRGCDNPPIDDHAQLKLFD